MEHIALTRRNSGTGWLLMGSDGRQWTAEAVSGTAPLAAMVNEALALVARNPKASFTFSTRAAHEVWAAPFDQQADLADIRRALGASVISIMVPTGTGCWRLLHRDPGGWFKHIDTCEPEAVHDFLRHWPHEAEAIDSGLAGPVEVWLRRKWDALAVLEPIISAAGDNVMPFIRKPPAMALNGANQSA